MELSAEQKQQLQEQKQHCPFCKIVSGEIPSHKVYEDDKVVAILDINPFKKGHTLVLPKEHYPIMPLLPEDEFTHLFNLIPEMTKHLKKTLLAKHCYTYIANGAAAGQQAGHFMVHLIPSDAPIPEFSPATKELDTKAYTELQSILENNLPIMMRKRAPLFPLSADQGEEEIDDADERSRRLAELLEENPDFKQTLINNPEAVKAGIQENESLQELFSDVDVDALSQKLKDAQQEVPETIASQPEPTPQEKPDGVRAVDMTDAQLKAFVNEKTKLKELLLTDIDTLIEAIPQQEKLQVFFDQTTPQVVASRIQNTSTSLEDLAQ